VRRRIPIVAVVVGVLVAGVAWSQAAEARAKGRRATATYTSPAVGLLGQGGFGQCDGEDGVGCVLFFTRPNEHHVTVKVTDQSGQPVYATVVQSKTNPGGYGLVQGTQRGAFCGKTKKPISITGGQRVAVYLYEGPGPDGCPGVATQGTVKATFTR
jgi:hypothetical protein